MTYELYALILIQCLHFCLQEILLNCRILSVIGKVVDMCVLLYLDIIKYLMKYIQLVFQILKYVYEKIQAYILVIHEFSTDD